MKMALHGKKESGKSTIADYLVEHYELDAFAFAYALKLDLLNMGIAPSVMSKKPWPKWLRVLAQLYGASMRTIRPDYWILRCFDDIEESGSDAVVIEDMRYHNEAVACRDDGYVLVKVVKVGHLDGDTHASEVELDDWDDWDYVIEAEPGDLMSLFDAIDGIIEKEGA